jgi:serine/threonine protein kinase
VTFEADAPRNPRPEERAAAIALFSTETFGSLPRAVADRAPADRLPLPVDSTLKHYEIIRKLGEGGMGTVFLARDTKLGRLVAITVLLKGQRP